MRVALFTCHSSLEIYPGWHTSIAYSFLTLNNTLSYKCTAPYRTTHPLKDIGVVFSLVHYE